MLFVTRQNKRALLLDVLKSREVTRAIVFTRTKHCANRLAKQLNAKKVRAEAIHGNKSQNARQRALQSFSSGRVKVLVATDIVSRGIDVTGVSHVINYELPNEPESYVHRIGRTARAGNSGIALSFCDKEEAEYLAGIEKLLKRNITVCEDHAHHADDIAEYHSLLRLKKPTRSARKRRPAGPRNRHNAKRRPSNRSRRPRRKLATNS